MAINVLKNPGRALDKTANVASATASRDPEAALSSLSEVISFYHTVEALHLGNFAEVFCLVK